MTKAQRHRVIYFDSVGGASGDMILASLLDLGADLKAIESGLKKIVKDRFSIEARRIRQDGFGGVQVTVKIACHDEHGHHHPPSLKLRRVPQRLVPSGSDSHGGLHRNLKDIEKLIYAGKFSTSVKQNVVSVFRRLAQAEAKVHGVKPDDIHFHEVGALDSIIDIIGACIALEQLGAEQVAVGPLPLGHGTIKCAHGILPSPAPATVELLRGFAVEQTDEPFELVTPTGAALLTTWSKLSLRQTPRAGLLRRSKPTGYEGWKLAAHPDFSEGGRRAPRDVPMTLKAPQLNTDQAPAGAVLERIGCGYGNFVLNNRPNLLRAMLLECGNLQKVGPHSLCGRRNGSSTAGQGCPALPTEAGLSGDADSCLVLECNLDDITPQLAGNLSEKLLAGGALEAFITPVQMKKWRPGILLTVLCSPEKRSAMLDLIFRESTTFGVREHPVQRTILPRRFEKVKTPYGTVRVKIGSWQGKDVTTMPEYEDCRKLAEKKGVPLRKVYEAALIKQKSAVRNQ